MLCLQRAMLVVDIVYQNCRKCTQMEDLARVVPSATRRSNSIFFGQAHSS